MLRAIIRDTSRMTVQTLAATGVGLGFMYAAEEAVVKVHLAVEHVRGITNRRGSDMIGQNASDPPEGLPQRTDVQLE